MSEQAKGFFNNILANAAWDGIKRLLWGPAVLAGIVGLWEKVKHGSLDWLAIVGMFVVASTLAFFNFRGRKNVPSSPLQDTGKDWREAFFKPQWEIIAGHSFMNSTVEVDGKSFRDCKFQNVTFVFHGKAPVEFVGTNQISGSFSLNTDNLAVTMFSKLQRFARNIPGARIVETAVDERGNTLPDAFQITPASLPTHEVDVSDPRINVRISDEQVKGLRQTPLILHNQGKEVAHQIQVEPIKFRSALVEFPLIESLEVDSKSKTMPKISGSLPHVHMLFHNIVPLLEDAWAHNSEPQQNQLLDVNKPFSIPAKITYRNFNDTARFETNFEIRYWGLHESLRRNNLLAQDQPSIEIVNVGFKRIS